MSRLVEQLILRIVPGVDHAVAELLAGKADIVRVVPFDQMQAVDNSDVAKTKTQSILRVGFRLDAMGRTSENPFQDVRVRHAANHACDIQGYIDASSRAETGPQRSSTRSTSASIPRSSRTSTIRNWPRNC